MRRWLGKHARDLGWLLPLGVFAVSIVIGAFIPEKEAEALVSPPDDVPAEKQAELREALSEYAHPIVLEDGTHCVVFYARHQYSGAGGITCDWETAPHRQGEAVDEEGGRP